jgi:hypothetical protein
MWSNMTRSSASSGQPQPLQQLVYSSAAYRGRRAHVHIGALTAPAEADDEIQAMETICADEGSALLSVKVDMG